MPDSKPTRLQVRFGGRTVLEQDVYDFECEKDGEAITVHATTQPTLPGTTKPKRKPRKKAAEKEPEPEPEVSASEPEEKPEPPAEDAPAEE